VGEPARGRPAGGAASSVFFSMAAFIFKRRACPLL